MKRITPLLLGLWLTLTSCLVNGQTTNNRSNLPTALLQYAEARGVRTPTAGDNNAQLIQLLFTLAYGVKDQTYFDYADKTNVPERIDTARIHAMANAIRRTGDWPSAVASIEPSFPDYQRLSKVLAQTSKAQTTNTQLLRIAVNGYRLLNRFGPYNRIVVINIPQGELTVIDRGNTSRLRMAVKVGTSKNQTPRFYTLVRQVNLYPYWTAPQNEIDSYLPNIRSHTLPAAFYVVRKKDSLRIEGHDRKLQRISARKFNKRYWLKKGPGSDNPLGVVRINFLQSYEDIYLHDTNERKAFCQTPTPISHGCIRLQKPLSLANLLLESRSDWTPLRYQDKGCYQEPTDKSMVENRPFLVKDTIPIFIVYFPAFYDERAGKVVYRDIYKKFR